MPCSQSVAPRYAEDTRQDPTERKARRADKTIVLDFGFTSPVTKEIVQAKAWDPLTGESVCGSHPIKGPMCASAVVCCGGILKPTVGNMFDSEQFGVLLKRIGGTVDGSFCGFSIKTDKEALAGYRIFLKDYSDVYEMFALNDRYEKRLALEGRSLEALYYMAFKMEGPNLPEISRKPRPLQGGVIDKAYGAFS